MMTREQKQQEISSLSDRFGRSQAAFLMDFKGMNVEQMTDLRKKLAPIQSELKVVRNTLAKLALKEHPEQEKALSEKFVGTNAVVFSYEDASTAAKALTEFAKDVEELVLRSGVMDGNALDEKGIEALSKLPGKDELRAMLLGTLQAPMSKFVRVLNEVPSGFVRTLNAYKGQKEEQS